MEQVYDFDLMERGGHLAGWKLGRGEQLSAVAGALQALADPAAFNARYGTQDQPVLLFAVGDGNHSLATAKECYERQKRITPQESVGDPALPVRPWRSWSTSTTSPWSSSPSTGWSSARSRPRCSPPCAWLTPDAPGGGGRRTCDPLPTTGTPGGLSPSLTPPPSWRWEPFSPSWTGGWRGGPACSLDDIHGAEVVEELARRPKAIGFLLPPMKKEELFPTVIHDGVLPRKTFSMGEAHAQALLFRGPGNCGCEPVEDADDGTYLPPPS